MTQWKEIELATKETGKEIIGAQINDGRFIKEPFITLWSPTLNKFYCNPTHFIPLPDMPERESK